jgi:DNA-binding transcriptional LysR family regulator
MDRITAMAVFTQVVDAGSVSVTARRLGLSRSAVSKQLAQLEDRLGARLVQRTTRRLALTEAGAEFYARCTRIVHEVEEAEQGVSRLHAGSRGLLKVNAPMTFGHRHLAAAIAQFLERYPDVQVEMTLNDQITSLRFARAAGRSRERHRISSPSASAMQRAYSACASSVGWPSWGICRSGVSAAVQSMTRASVAASARV